MSGGSSPARASCSFEKFVGARGFAAHRLHGGQAAAGDRRVLEQHEPAAFAARGGVVGAHDVDRREREPRLRVARRAREHALELRARGVEAMLGLRDLRAPERDLERRLRIRAPGAEAALRVRDQSADRPAR